MVGFLVAAHGGLADSLLAAAQMLGGQTDSIAALGLMEKEGPDEFYERVCRALEKLDTGDGVVALVDLFGGTPFNTVFRASREYNVSIVAGVNLPMILSAVFDFDGNQSREETAELLCGTGKEQIRRQDYELHV